MHPGHQLRGGKHACSTSYKACHTGVNSVSKWSPKLLVSCAVNASVPRTCKTGSYTDQQLLSLPLDVLMKEAAAVRDNRYTAITFSPKVFIPLTRLCRDTCGYCTFALPPKPGRRVYMTLDEVLAVAKLGAEQGCTEALFTLGDKPELRWTEAAQELSAMGYSSTLEYVEAAAAAVLTETGLLPHINAGIMNQTWLTRLKKVSASQGLMLEGTAPSLMQPGGAHESCPDKEASVRLDMLQAAGMARVPFTTGILVGIGETREERLAALRAIQSCHQEYGHIQEVIVQNFRAKKGTRMASWPEPPATELLWSVAAARLIMSPDVTIQAPPNLTPELDDAAAPQALSKEASWKALIDAGINDWGGISSITRDYVNPEAPWPHLTQLAQVTAEAGFHLLPRLPVYPQYIGLRGSTQHSNHTMTSMKAEAQQTPIVSSNGCHGDVLHDHNGNSKGRASSNTDVPGTATAAQPHAASRRHTHTPVASSVHSDWLDGQGGRDSIRAAVLRCSDSAGFARGSTWYAGMMTAGDEPMADRGTNQTHNASHLSEQNANGMHSPATEQSTDVTVTQNLENVTDSTNEQQQQEQGSKQRPSTPHAAVRKDKAWKVARDVSGGLAGMPRPAVSSRVQHILDKIFKGVHAPEELTSSPLSEDDIAVLLSACGADADAIIQAADTLRRLVCGDEVTYVVNRNINYTNVCTLQCGFCAFSKGKVAEELRGPAYLVSMQEISRRSAEAWDRGATEVCMQGGIHPSFTGQTYLDILQAAKAGAPHIHVHAFSPLEVHQGASTLGLSLRDYLCELKAAGLGSLPGTAAEVLFDDVRAQLCPDKINTDRWLEVVRTAHEVGIRTTSTLMFGHIEHGPAAWARHLTALRDLQARTGGITEFVPLPFVHMEAPIYLKGQARRGPTLHECFLLHAVARLALHPHITNIQASWVKMGPQHAAALLAAGCNDMGGSLMNESITRAAGASHGQELPPYAMEHIIRAAGRAPRQRTTTYGQPSAAQTDKSLSAAALTPLQPLVLGKAF